MKAKNVLKIMNITRQTLSKYVKRGKLRINHLPNGDYDYDPESVYEAMNGGKARKILVCLKYDEVPDVMQKFIKDKLGEDIEITDCRTADEFSAILKAVREFRVKAIAVLDDDYETISCVERNPWFFKEAGCEMILLKGGRQDENWNEWDQERFSRLVRVLLGNVKDDVFSRKLAAIDGIMRI